MSEKDLDIKVTLNQEEVMTNLNNAVAHVLKAEMVKSVKDMWRDYQFTRDMKNKLREMMVTEGEKVIAEILADYEDIKTRVEEQVFRSLSARVAKMTKRLEDAQ